MAKGMSEDLGLTGNQYNVVLSIFFVTYISFGGSLTTRLRSHSCITLDDELELLTNQCRYT